jgi:nucleoside-triphosphatase
LVKILLEGRPGSGKTTVAGRLADLLRDSGIDVSGFVTREVRAHGRRVGFEVETMDGLRAMLAHSRFGGPPRVGRYGVDLGAFERVALPVLEDPPKDGLVLIDELGKMELASAPFREAVMALFEAPIDIVATVHVFRHPLTDALKRRTDIESVRITKAGRDAMPEQLAERLLGARGGAPRG